MRCYYRNSISCGANRRKFEDQSVIKGKLKANGIIPSWSLILGRAIPEGRKEEIRREEVEEEEEEEEERYGNYLCMDCYGFVWIIAVPFLGFS